MSCKQIPTDCPSIPLTITVSVTGLMVSFSCLYHSLQDWRAPHHHTASDTETINTRLQAAIRRTGHAGVGEIPDTARQSSSNLEAVPDSRQSFTTSPSSSFHMRGGLSALRHLWKLTSQAPPRQFAGRTRMLNAYLRVLLQASWIVFVADSICNLAHVCALTWSCPQFNCYSSHVHHTIGCISGPFMHTQLFLQPTASALFALATMNRFVGVYSILSTWRFLTLRIGSFVIIVVTTARLVTLAGLTFHTYWPWETDQSSKSSAVVSIARALDDIVHYVMWTSFALLELGSLLIGLQHVLSVRGELDSVLHHQEHAPGSWTDLAKEAVCKENTKLVTQGPSSVRGAAGKRTNLQRYRAQTSRVLACITVNLLLLVTFFITQIPSVYESFPATFLFTFLGLFVKVFAGASTIAIHVMTDFVISQSDNYSLARSAFSAQVLPLPKCKQ